MDTLEEGKTTHRMATGTTLIVFALALIVRLIYTAQAWRSPLFQTPMLDADTYYRLARQFASGEWLAPAGKPYWQPPFYPFALGAWISVMGSGVLGIKLAQATLGSINCALVFVLGHRMFDRRVGLAAGLAAALYGPLIYFDGELLTPTLQILLNLCVLIVLLRAVERKSLWLTGSAGLLLGLSAITRPDVMLLAVAGVVWLALALRTTMSGKAAAAACAVFLLGVAIPIVLVTVRNVSVGRDLVPISWNGGINFYIGNNPDEARTREIRPGPEWDRMLAMAENSKQNPKSSEKSAYFAGKSLRYITDHPLAFAGLLAKKSVEFATAIEGRRNLDIYYNRSCSSLLSVVLFRTGPFGFPFGVALPLGVLGIALRPRRPGVSLFYWYLAAQFVAVVAFFVTARYRVTVIPVLLIFAAYGALELWNAIRQQHIRSIAMPLALAAAVLVLSNINVFGVDSDRDRIDADTQLYLADALVSQGKTDEALGHYEQSVRLNPDYEVSRLNLAMALIKLGRGEDAKAQLRAALRIEPDSPASHAMLAHLLLSEGDVRQAAKHVAVAAQSDPRFVDRLIGIAEKAYGQGDYESANLALRAVVKLRPDWGEARRTYGVTLMKLGRFNEAISQLRRACEIDPSSADCFIALGLAYQRSGDRQHAESAFARAVEIGPADEVRGKIRGYTTRSDR